jgi:hypothetical protein
MWHISACKLAATYKMTLIYFLVNIHINNQSTLYKVKATYKMTLMYFLVNIHINNQSTLYEVNGVLNLPQNHRKPSNSLIKENWIKN